MWPAASVSGLYFAHPEARYFAVDRMTRDQVEDYAQRKGMPRGRSRTLAGAELGLRAVVTACFLAKRIRRVSHPVRTAIDVQCAVDRPISHRALIFAPPLRFLSAA